MFDLTSNAGFTDGNNLSVKSLDVVEYRYEKRRGILIEVMQDGDAYVLFRDTKKVETVKWKNLCKVPEFVSVDANGVTVLDESHCFKQPKEEDTITKLKDRLTVAICNYKHNNTKRHSITNLIDDLVTTRVREALDRHESDFKHEYDSQ